MICYHGMRVHRLSSQIELNWHFIITRNNAGKKIWYYIWISIFMNLIKWKLLQLPLNLFDASIRLFNPSKSAWSLLTVKGVPSIKPVNVIWKSEKIKSISCWKTRTLSRKRTLKILVVSGHYYRVWILGRWTERVIH